MPSTVTVNGREYPIDELHKEVLDLADMLAGSMKLVEPNLLDTADYTEAEVKAILEQINAMMIFPSPQIDSFWSAFAARHLAKLAKMMKSLSLPTQKQVMSVSILVLSLLPDPKHNPYFRKFLASPFCTDSPGLPNIVASSFSTIGGIDWLRPGGPGQICTLLIHFLFWCTPEAGDDKNASIDSQIRTTLAQRLDSLLKSQEIQRLDQHQRVELKRLQGILTGALNMPGPPGYYLQSTRQYLEGQTDGCHGNNCDEEPTMQCSSCKVYRYCGTRCQAWHWKKGHKLMCFKTEF